MLVIIYLCNRSLEEKLSVLEDENHVLRQKTLSLTPNRNHPGFAKALSEVSFAFVHVEKHICRHTVCLVLLGSMLYILF